MLHGEPVGNCRRRISDAMTGPATLSRRKKLRFYGWGYADDRLSADEEARIRESVKRFGIAPNEVSPPREDEFDLRPPRISAPSSLAPIMSVTPYDRLVHSYGKSYADIVRMFMRDVRHPPDMVAFPKSERDVIAILDWASRANVAAIPFGGGSSVAGGVVRAVRRSRPVTRDEQGRARNVRQQIRVAPLAARRAYGEVVVRPYRSVLGRQNTLGELRSATRFPTR